MTTPVRIYYHLSPRAGLKQLDPKWTDPEHSSPSEARACRVCLSSSILGCLRSLQEVDGTELFVYLVAVDADAKFIPNKYVQHLVPDAYLTKECWVMEPIKCLCEGKIQVISWNTLNPKWKWIQRYRK